MSKSGEESEFIWKNTDDPDFSRYELVLKCLRDIKAAYGNHLRLDAVYTVKKSTDLISGQSELLLRSEPADNTAPVEKPTHYNFGELIPGLVYRSRHLGTKGLNWLEKWLHMEQKPFVRSIASVHVYGYGGGKMKHRLGSLIMPEYFNLTYNIEEFEFSRQRGLHFLHSYSSDPGLRVYFDGKDPSDIPENNSSHGNIYRRSTISQYVSRVAMETMNINPAHEPVEGDTSDFLKSLLNIIRTPWPVLIHCKGGKHKTGMLSMVITFLYREHNVAKKQGSTDASDLKYLYETYFKFNSDPVEKNIDFVRKLLRGELFSSELGENKRLWENIRLTFSVKLMHMQKWILEEEAKFFFGITKP